MLRRELIAADDSDLLRRASRREDHLMEMDKRSLRLSERGQIFGFVIALVFIAAATAMVFGGYPAAGTILGTIDIVALVAVFVTGRHAPSRDEGQAPADVNPQPLSPDVTDAFQTRTDVAQPPTITREMDEKLREVMYRRGPQK